MRLIDADAFRREIDNHWPFTKEEQSKHGIADMAKGILLYVLNCMPTIEPQRWIPCSERLPKNDVFVIVTILDERGDTPYRFSDFGWYFDRVGCWIIDAEERTDVIAWMPLPEPYKGAET